MSDERLLCPRCKVAGPPFDAFDQDGNQLEVPEGRIVRMSSRGRIRDVTDGSEFSRIDYECTNGHRWQEEVLLNGVSGIADDPFDPHDPLLEPIHGIRPEEQR